MPVRAENKEHAVVPDNIDLAMAQRIVNHWKTAISDSDLRTEPYEHFHLTKAFPDDIYELILKHKVSADHFRAFNLKKWKRADGTSTRDMMFLCDDSFEVFDEVRRHFWATLTYAFCSEVFRQLIFTKLKRDVSLRLGVAEEEVLSTPGFVDPWLIRDTQGYRIKPHPDGAKRVVTLMFYLPQDDSTADLGTSVYTDRGRIAGFFGRRYKEVYRFPFVRNSLAVFAVNDLPEKRSLHGRELVETPGERNSILLAFMSDTIKVKNTEHWVPSTHDGLN